MLNLEDDYGVAEGEDNYRQWGGSPKEKDEQRGAQEQVCRSRPVKSWGQDKDAGKELGTGQGCMREAWGVGA